MTEGGVFRLASFGEYVEDEMSSTLQSRDYKGATDLVVQVLPILMRQREGKPGGGKGPLISEDLSLTIATANDQVLFQPIVFSHTQGLDSQASEEASPTLRANGSGQAVAYEEAYSIREDAKADTFSATPLEVTNALQAHQPSVQSHHAQTFITQETQMATIVRRLTPTECERLQGFPDGWTAQRFDFKKQTVIDQKDSARYKQMGNAVAVPCVAWILRRLVDYEQR